MIMKSSKTQKANNFQSKIILFDIDYTLFDVSYLKRKFYESLSIIWDLPIERIEEKSIDITTKIVEKKGYLDLDEYINSLVKVFGKNKDLKKVEDLLLNSGFIKKAFYKEVGELLELLKSFARIGIFSHGDSKLQWAKLEQSGFKDYFDKDIIYIKNKKMDFLPALKEKHLKDKVFLVDDKPNVIDEVKKIMPNVFTIWIKRGEFIDRAKKIENFKPDATISNLLEVVKIVEKS